MRFAPPICCLFCTRIPACVGVGETHRILFHGSFRIWTVDDWARTSGCCDGGWAYDFYVFRPDDQNTLKRTHPRALWQRTWVDSTDLPVFQVWLVQARCWFWFIFEAELWYNWSAQHFCMVVFYSTKRGFERSARQTESHPPTPNDITPTGNRP